MPRISRKPSDPVGGRTDWQALRNRSDEEVEAAARADPDAQPLSDEELMRLRRVPNVKAMRERIGLTQKEFAKVYRLALGTVRDWEQGRTRPEGPASVLLSVINRFPFVVAEALSAQLVERAGVPANRDPANSYHVVPGAGGWVVRYVGGSEAASTHRTQLSAVKNAKKKARSAGYDLVIHGKDGLVRHRYSYGRHAQRGVD